MVLYRRNRVVGGTYFFTVTLRNRSSDILVRHVDLLRDAFRSVRAERPFTIATQGHKCHCDIARTFTRGFDLAGR
jgi:REP element-mobilizing transposase RayT